MDRKQEDTGNKGQTRLNLRDMELPALQQLMQTLGEPAFRAKQIFGWLAKGADSFAEMTNLPNALKEKLQAVGMDVSLPTVLRVQVSAVDGTRKYLFGLADGNAIESVMMRYKYGNSLCVSSQAGCRMGCRFCASGLDGLVRNLRAGEIYGQILAAERESGETINHVVVMGTGEPFDNYDNLAAFLRILHDKAGRQFSLRNITVSTCGLVPMISRFAEAFPQVNLAISLHAPTDQLRGQMMPVNQAYPLQKLIPACRAYCETTSRRLTFEYTLVRGVNDGQEQARQLADLLSGLLCHVNLIPLNAVQETGLRTTARREAEAFRAYLENRGIPATIRRELGDDIDGACGQLRLSTMRRETAKPAEG